MSDGQDPLAVETEGRVEVLIHKKTQRDQIGDEAVLCSSVSWCFLVSPSEAPLANPRGSNAGTGSRGRFVSINKIDCGSAG